MIIFSVAFGESYVERLFSRCLPSLLRGAAQADPLTLVVFTLPEFHEHIRTAAERSGVEKHVSKFAVSTPPVDPGTPSAQAFAGQLLRYAVALCLAADDVWFHAVPDLIYAADTLSTCERLHRLTGKTVAIFNGRTRAPADADDPLQGSIAGYFRRNMSDQWLAHRPRADEPCGHIPGQLIYDREPHAFVFCSTPNPVLGRFEPADVLSLGRGMAAWDHEWREALERQNRLLVCPDLNAAMSIEPVEGRDPKPPARELARFEGLAARAEADAATRRRAKFTAVPTYLFTMAKQT